MRSDEIPNNPKLVIQRLVGMLWLQECAQYSSPKAAQICSLFRCNTNSGIIDQPRALGPERLWFKSGL